MRPVLSIVSCAFAVLTCASASDPLCATCGADGEMIAAGRMTEARASHSAVLLRDGRVLISGGCTRQWCESGPGSVTTEFFDVTRGTFVRGPDMHTSRSGDHVAIALADGRVLLAGGWSGQEVVAHAELFDPAHNRFVRIAALTTPRAAAVALPLSDGRVLIAGGYDGTRRLASAEIFDPATGSFTSTGDMTTARSAHAGTLLADGRVIVTGGDAERGVLLASAEIYDPARGTFTRTGDLGTVRYKHAMVTLADGRVLVIGGSDLRDWNGRYASVELYDAASGRFRRADDMRMARFKLPRGAVRLPDGRVLVATGARQAELFDPASGTFALVPGDMRAVRHFASATVLSDGRVLVLGGYDQRIDVTAEAWIYRP